jgi:hypothetical protein
VAFADDIAEAFADLLAENGRTITYAGTEITALVSLGEAPRRGRSLVGSGEGKSQINQAVIQVLKSDVAAPAYRDQVVIDGVTWRVEKVLRSNGCRSMVALFADERVRP